MNVQSGITLANDSFDGGELAGLLGSAHGAVPLLRLVKTLILTRRLIVDSQIMCERLNLGQLAAHSDFDQANTRTLRASRATEQGVDGNLCRTILSNFLPFLF